MGARGFAIVLTIAGLVFAGIWWVQVGSEERNERLFFAQIDEALSKDPPDAADVRNALDLPDECQTNGSCFFGAGEIGSLQYKGGSLRKRGRGLILVVKNFGGSCIRRSEVQSHFETGPAQPGCAGGGCWYASAQFSWGGLLFGLDNPNARCVSSVVINSTAGYRQSRLSE